MGNKMNLKIAKLPKGLREIGGDHVWHIKSGWDEYLFVGTMDEFKKFKKETYNLDGLSRGANVRYRRITKE